MSLTKVPFGTVRPQNTAFELTTPAASDPSSVPDPVRAAPLALARRPLQPIVIGFGRMGDMVMLSSVLHLLRLRFGRPCLVLGAGSWNARLFEAHPDVAWVRSFTRHFPFMLSLTWWRVLWALHRSAPSPIYVFERQSRQLARIRRMLAIGGVDPNRCLFVTDVLKDEEHWVDRFTQLAQRTPAALNAADYPSTGVVPRPAPRLTVTDAERVELNAWLARQGWTGRKLVLIQPGNFRSMSKRREKWRRLNADDKAWPLENWVALLRRVHTNMPEALIVLCGAPQEGRMLQEIRGAVELNEIVVAELSLRQLLAVCESAHSMISVDTGPAHAAAALSLPLIVMYGAESQRQWLPRSPSGSAVIGIGGPPVSNRVDRITVEVVYDAWCSLLPAIRKKAQPLIQPTPTCELT